MKEHVVVMGLGASGVAAAKLLVERGYAVTGVDLREDRAPIEGVRLELGPHNRHTFMTADRIVVSPGVPPTQSDIAAAAAAGVPIWGEVELAIDALGRVPLVGITGTNGKSTVTHLTGQLLSADRPTFVGGNLGTPLCAAVGKGFEAYVVELSSYQLERPGALCPTVGTILNLTPDHLTRHGDMEGYAKAKANLFRNQTDEQFAFLPADPQIARAVRDIRSTRLSVGSTPGVRRDGVSVTVQVADRAAQFDLTSLALAGEHNLDNAAMALALAFVMGVAPAQLQATIPALTSLPHRMQVVPSGDGRRWINDSKSTNVASTLAALRGRKTPTVLLLGGQAKGPGFSELVDHLSAVHTVLCFGGSGADIADELEGCRVATVRADSLEDAVTLARRAAVPGDDILLSPGCASFDAFDHFGHRGDVFMALVAKEE